jgi:hypothetical protein
VEISLYEKITEIRRETPRERVVRNFLLAGRSKRCYFCPHVQPTCTFQSWQQHMNSSAHMEEEESALRGNCKTIFSNYMIFFACFFAHLLTIPYSST